LPLAAFYLHFLVIWFSFHKVGVLKYSSTPL
jgi:hypothetical protein